MTSMRRRIAGKKAQRMGDYVERLAQAELLRQGASRAEILATPIKMVRGKPIRTRKVLADIVGWWPGSREKPGRALLCECKCRQDGDEFRRPVRSDFEDHQIDNLRQCAKDGGTALVAYLYRVPNQGVQLLIEPAENWFS